VDFNSERACSPAAVSEIFWHTEGGSCRCCSHTNVIGGHAIADMHDHVVHAWRDSRSLSDEDGRLNGIVQRGGFGSESYKDLVVALRFVAHRPATRPHIPGSATGEGA